VAKWWNGTTKKKIKQAIDESLNKSK
jgi:hypothetical protein